MRGRTLTLEVTEKRGKAAKTIPLYQYDYGQKLLIEGVELPEYYEVHFSNQQYGDAVTVLGDSTGVLIPDSLVATGESIYVWLYLHDTSYDGETEYMGVIPVIKRAEPSDITPTPEEQSIITEVIAALNNMEDDMSDQVNEAKAAKEAAEDAQAGAEAAETTVEGYASAAATAKEAAETAQTAAETAQAAAEAASNAATTAYNNADSARSSAVSAKEYAETAATNASTSATSASGYATNAQNSASSALDAQAAAETAQGKAEDAQTAAETAQAAAEAAEDGVEADALIAEGYAVGKQNGEDVASGSTYYHNNAKYYADAASDSATAAAGSEDNAEDSAEDAEAYAVGTRGGVDVESDDPAYENNAKYYAEEAATVLEDKLDAPATAGTVGQVLTSDGEGGQAWADPSGAIDDTAGEGDTDVTWSADKLDGEFADVLTAIHGLEVHPYQLNMGADRGYIDGNDPLVITRSATKGRAIFAWLKCGKGTVVSIDDTIITGFEVRKWNLLTGEYIEKQGALLTNKQPITVSEDCIIMIYANTSYTDAADYYDTINNAISIKYFEPNIELVEYPCPFEYGSMDTNNGGLGTYAENRIRTSNFYHVGAGTAIYMENTIAKIRVFMYTTDEAYFDLSAEITNPVYIVPYDAKIKLYGINWEYNTFSSASEIKPKIRYVEPTLNDIPFYYKTNNYIYTRVDDILAHEDNCNYNGITFAFLTDTHWDSSAKMSPSLIKYISEHTSLRDIVFNGDGITDYSSKEGAYYNYNIFRSRFSAFTGEHWMPVIGNHELNNPGNVSGAAYELTPAEAYGLVISENDRIITPIDVYAYYIDLTNKKVRMLFVGCQKDSQIPSATRTAVISAINATPADYKILVCSHVAITGTGATGTIADTFQPILDALDLVHSKVICVLSGHRHADGTVETSAGVRVIASTCDALLEQGSLTRTRRTISEGAFDVVQIDLTNSKIYLTRIGAGSNRSYDICQ